MTITPTSHLGLRIRRVWVDNQPLPDYLTISPSEGWVDINDYIEEGGRRLLRKTPEGKPVVKRLYGVLRIEWIKS